MKLTLYSPNLLSEQEWSVSRKSYKALEHFLLQKEVGQRAESGHSLRRFLETVSQKEGSSLES